ncbi:aliphatic sulfonate ABC transporter substrate-binding protein [Oceanobacillus alkalisoli]|uniref:aliphatic sulfonate ABC transporter substrate-binding protein n=1 Tax=Oceanobacillus alkalisoli TaxID=2925113 RepID=UPI001F11AA79|nr:aliphatic sulfonate ABC transporter substrate-binding protein [Oceanobacillus alkalisoli]MCF3944547.1 aliphatic sulfonate ABC transporter substrate-binding protein [Oceanobacillus alkalisoli]
MRNTFILKLGIILISTVLFLVGCGTEASDTSSNKSENVIKVGFQKGNTLHLLKETGFLEEALAEEDYEVQWEMFTHGGTLMEGIYAGAIDYGHAADGPGIIAQATGKPIVYVGADAPNPEGVGLLVLKESGIESVADLKGKKIAALESGNHRYLTVLALEKAGLTNDDVEWVFPEDAGQGRTIFETGQVDALASYDPYLASAEGELDTISLTAGEDYEYPNRTFYFASTTFAEGNPELLDLILETIDKADQWANENNEEVVELLSDSLGISEEIIGKQIARRTFGATPITQEIIDTQQKQADVYYDIGLIPEEIDVSEVMPVGGE